MVYKGLGTDTVFYQEVPTKSLHLIQTPLLAPLILITTYNSGNTRLQKIITRFWPFLGRSNASKDLSHQRIIVAHTKPLSFKSILVKAKALLPSPQISAKYPNHLSIATGFTSYRLQEIPGTTPKCRPIFKAIIPLTALNAKSGIQNMSGQTMNRIRYRFLGYLFDIQHNANTKTL